MLRLSWAVTKYFNKIDHSQHGLITAKWMSFTFYTSKCIFVIVSIPTSKVTRSSNHLPDPGTSGPMILYDNIKRTDYMSPLLIIQRKTTDEHWQEDNGGSSIVFHFNHHIVCTLIIYIWLDNLKTMCQIFALWFFSTNFFTFG